MQVQTVVAVMVVLPRLLLLPAARLKFTELEAKVTVRVWAWAHTVPIIIKMMVRSMLISWALCIFALGLLRLLRRETTHLPLKLPPNYGVACAWIFSVPV